MSYNNKNDNLINDVISEHGLSYSSLIKTIIDNTPIAYIIMDDSFCIHYINEYFMNLRQLRKETTIGERCYNLSNNGVKCAVCAVDRANKDAKKHKVLRKDILPSGDLRYIDDYAVPLFTDVSTKKKYFLEIMVNRTNEMVIRDRLSNDFSQLIKSLSSLLEAKDEYTANHSSNVRKYSVALAKKLGLSEKEIYNIEIAASLHDIGKILIPYDIINKNGKLTDEEFDMIKTHATESFNMLSHAHGFGNMKEDILYHHEKWNGTGYPKGLKETEIPLGARIIAVADTYDAMTSTRSYRKALSHEIAVDEIKRFSGIQFDPAIVEAFLCIDMEKVRNNLAGNEPVDAGKVKKQVERVIQSLSHAESNPEPLSLSAEADNDISGLINNDNITEEQFISEIFTHSPLGYAVMNEDFEVVLVNDFFCELTGYKKEKIYKHKCYEFNHSPEEIVNCNKCILKTSLISGTIHHERIRKTFPSGVKYVDVYGVPFTNPGNEKKYVIQMMLDMTHEVELQEAYDNEIESIVKMLLELLSKNHEKTSAKTKIINTICTAMVDVLKLDTDEKRDIVLASLLAHIGMIALHDTSSEVLDRREIYSKHTQVATDFLQNISSFANVSKIIANHHNLNDESVRCRALIGARLIAIAEAISDLMQDDNLSLSDAVENLKTDTMNRYDQKLVNLIEQNKEKIVI